ncbi:uncharacterized protein B0H18DRAFT_964760 [Fomitopsis serialis]|uniref:uncharacterized protein n=1 Tax=Fomitopsis serialis TaxID=139415 RepID=UPI00200832BC|nr:uncharacterized protein B0H18DRAFT_964760 [Neoantrodia serialis]KAH9906114.1 hypothetical protein B0H18DRAFT_964760 [Neoantrodia serialis]
MTIRAENYALGKHREIVPMCSMKASFMPNMEFVWPTEVVLPRLRFRASWRFMDIIPPPPVPQVPKINTLRYFNGHESLGLLLTMDELDALPNPPKLGGWLFLGHPGDVQSIFNTGVHHARRKKTGWKLPVSLPLIADVVEDRPGATPSVIQLLPAITVQMFPAQRGRHQARYTPRHHYYTAHRIVGCCAGNVWARNILRSPSPNPNPVFKLADVTAAMYAGNTRLEYASQPLCSMKRRLSALGVTWPTGLAQARSFIEADWTVGINESGETVATCSSLTRMDTSFFNTARSVWLQSGALHPAFEDIAYARQCPENKAISHVTVLCMEKEHLGRLFDYCPLCLPSDCPMRLLRAAQVGRTVGIEGRAGGSPEPSKLEGWLFPGAIKSAFRRGVAGKPQRGWRAKGYPCSVYVKAAALLPPAHHRPDLHRACWWRDPILRYRPEAFDMYNLKYRTWERLPSSPSHREMDRQLRLPPLPLCHILIFKPASLVTTPYPEGFSLGLLWPRGLKNLPSYVKAKWTVGSDDDGIVATCPGFGEEGNEMWEVDPEREDEDAAAAA